MRPLLALAALALLSGCPSGDLCVPEPDSTRVMHVEPSTAPGPDNSTVTSTFSTIQAALDAVGGDGGRATICVADGTYYEELSVPADTHLIAAGQVRIRPPQTREDALPTSVDRTLLTLHTGPEGSIRVQGFDVRYGGLCVAVDGDGAAEVVDSTVQDCAVGARVEGATLTLRSATLQDHSYLGVQVVEGRLNTFDTALLRNGRPAQGLELRALTEPDPEASWAEGLLGRGAVFARDSAVLLERSAVDENQYLGGVLDLQGGSLTLRDARLGAQRAPDNVEGFIAGEAGGDGPLISAQDCEVSIDGLRATSEGQALFVLRGGRTTLAAFDVNWNGRGESTSSGAPGAAIDADSTGAIALWHASLLGPAGAPGMRLVGEVAIPVAVTNSVFWGHGSGAGILREGANHGVDLRSSLFSDFSVTGEDMLSGDPEWDDDAAVLMPESSSRLRCAGLDLSFDPELVDRLGLDVLGNPRPFGDGAPDVGAIEVQLPCP